MPSDALTRPTLTHAETCASHYANGTEMCFCGGYERYLDALERYATALEGRVNQPFPDGSYDIPLDVRLRAATTEFSHPRLGIVATNKHWIPVTTDEAKDLLSLRARVEAGEADTRRLAKFAAWAFTTEDGWRGDLDGGEVQDMGEECGILVKVPVTEACGENCPCAECGLPADCYRLAQFVQDAAMREGAK